MLAEFVYGLKPKETFAKFGIDQAKPNRAFYYLKKVRCIMLKPSLTTEYFVRISSRGYTLAT